MSERFHEVVNAFIRYAKSMDGDRSEIEAISREDLEFARMKYSSFDEKNDPFYIAMEDRLAELKEQQNRKRTRREVWKDRWVGFGIAIVTGLIVAVLVWLLKLNK